MTTNVQISFLSDSGPTVGDEVTYGGVSLVCTEVEIEYAVGELVKGSATFVTKPDDDEE